MTTTHTPGPWTVDDTEYIDIVAPAGRVAMLDSDALDHRAIVANARLIANAPALLAALRGVVLCADARGDAEPLDAYQTRAAMLPGQIARAYAAIARATGADA